MPILLTAKAISKTFGSRALFENLDLVVQEDERVGLIGPNGAGKSTLLRILAGVERHDAGELAVRKGLRVGFLEQTPLLPDEMSVESCVMSALPDLNDDRALSLAGELFSKLELNPLLKALVGTLSGGWKKRVALTRELVKDPELLLLDEPTNHLDIESILWLETFLAKARVAMVLITHDRLFLQRVCSRIIELDRRNPGGLLSIDGTYADYVEKKEELIALQQREEQVLKNTLRRETEWLRRGPKARTTKQQARIQAAERLQEEVEALEYRNENRSSRLDFQSTGKKTKRLIEAKALSKSYSGRTLFRDLDLFIGPGSRIGLLGTNGCGKSTLIRVLLGEEEPDAGSVVRAEGLKFAYFEQNRETLDPEVTLRRTLCPSGDNVIYRGKPVHIHGYLDRFLFRKEQVDMKVGRLSGGEQSRILLARLMLQPADVLVLDEPTNDLDVQTLNVLEQCLTDFDGAVLLVTHDRYFLDQVANSIYAFPAHSGERILDFAGLNQWESWHAEKERQAKQVPRPTKASETPAKPKKLGYKETRELSTMEETIHEKERQLAVLQAQAESSAYQSNASKLTELYEGIARTQAEVDELYARWAELEALSK